MNVSFDDRFSLGNQLYENGCCTITKAKGYYITDEHREKLHMNGKKAKSYCIDMPVYRKISSSAINLYRVRKHKLIFLTLTFPGKLIHANANKCFSRFMDNLKTNYELNGYVAVHELTKKGNSHYHIIADIPFQSIFRLNFAWCSAFSDYFRYSPNALRLPEKGQKAVIQNLSRCVKYCCKYFGKGRYIPYQERCVFITHNVVSNRKPIDEQTFERLAEKFTVKIVDYAYCKIAYFQDVLEDYEAFLRIISCSPG
ncbi:hypothetical protein ES705_28071 [subsurface metagenome]